MTKVTKVLRIFFAVFYNDKMLNYSDRQALRIAMTESEEKPMVSRVAIAMDEAFDDASPPPMRCPHADVPHAAAVARARSGPVAACEDCPAPVEATLWLCVRCGHVGCGRYAPEGTRHALAHNAATGHHVAIGVADSMAWCFKCDDECDDASSLEPLRAALSAAAGEPRARRLGVPPRGCARFSHCVCVCVCACGRCA